MNKKIIKKGNFSDILIQDEEKIAKELLKLSNKSKLWLIDGKMGAGKTTLIRKICELLRVKDCVNSPTFSIINEYHTKNNEIIYHFDLYRLNNLKEAHEIGLDEYIHSGNYCFIEWPNKIKI